MLKFFYISISFTLPERSPTTGVAVGKKVIWINIMNINKILYHRFITTLASSISGHQRKRENSITIIKDWYKKKSHRHHCHRWAHVFCYIFKELSSLLSPKAATPTTRSHQPLVIVQKNVIITSIDSIAIPLHWKK